MSSPSIYRNISALADKGYIDGEIVREGEMPEKRFIPLMKKEELFSASYGTVRKNSSQNLS